jgi:hypothetical protein
MGFHDEDVGEVRESRAVRDDAREAYLLGSPEYAEAYRVGDGALHGRTRDARRPIALREIRMNDVHVETPLVCRDDVVVEGRHGQQFPGATPAWRWR